MQTTRELIEKQRDQETLHNQTAEKMIAVLEHFEGKKLTKRVLKPMEEWIGTQCFIDQSYGLVHIQTIDYVRGHYDLAAVSLTIPAPLGSTTLPDIDTEAIREANPAYLSAAIERNARRDAQLASNYPELCDQAGESYRAAKAELNQLTAYPCPDSSAIEKLAKGEKK